VIAYDDRRIHPRMTARWPVTILTDQGPVQGETMNIAAKGAYIQCEGQIDQNEAYQMVIGFDKQSVAVNGKVLWSDREAGGGRREVTRIGVVFLE
jgi:hypothetical protein